MGLPPSIYYEVGVQGVKPLQFQGFTAGLSNLS